MNWLAGMISKLARGLADFSPSCKAAARLQSEALDHPLKWRQRLGLRAHLALCRWCRRYGHQIAFLRHATRSRPEETAKSVPQPLSDEARERILQKLRAHKK